MKPTRSSCDVIPSVLFKEMVDSIGPSILSIMNSNWHLVLFWLALSMHLSNPFFKKAGLDSNDMNSFHPISKLPFISKILDKILYAQLNDFWWRTTFWIDSIQGLEPAKVQSQLFWGFLMIFYVVLILEVMLFFWLLLDLTTAFDTVDHKILIDCLRDQVGIQGLALEWFSSYLKDRTFSVSLWNYSSFVSPLMCGVPQGSILGPVLFFLFMLPLGLIFEKYGIHFHWLPGAVSREKSF